ADLQIEIDQRDIDGIGQGIEKLDGGRTHEPDVVGHAPAHVEEHAEVKRRRLLFRDVSGGKVPNRLLAAVFDNVEVAGGQVADDAAFAVGDGDGHVDEVNTSAKNGRLT